MPRHDAVDVLDELIPIASSGNSTSVEIAASPERVWRALHELTFRECRFTGALMAVRSIPGLIARRGALGRRRSQPDAKRPETVIAAMTSSRFRLLHDDPPRLLVIGIVGQFWKLSGGVDVDISDARAFEEFDEPGYVKSAIDFAIEPTTTGARLSTETRNHATDEAAARSFARYWKLIGWGSKATRTDMLRAVKRRAER